MGNWKNRRIFRERRAPRTPVYDTVPPPEWKEVVPLWEKKFCSLVGTIPWGKIVDTKNFMFCHKNILSWDDSAGEEALQNAKKRFWAKMNNLPCEISPPDPDIYIDEIDWNTKIDHELIKESDEVYFSPDEGEENSNLGYKNNRIKKSVSVPSEGHYMNQENNPWECNNMQGSGALKNKAQGWECNNMQDSGTLNINAQGWKQWEDNKNDLKILNHDNNPWGRSFTQGNGGQKLLNTAMDSLLTLPESAHPESRTTVHNENSAEEKPTVLWKALYIQELTMDHFESISSTPMPDGNLNYDNILHATLKLFQKMYPLEEVFPETYSPENPEDDNEFSLES